MEDDREEYKFKYIDNRLLSTPPITAFNDRSPELLGKVSEVEEEIDDIAVDLEGKHKERVKKGQCNAQVGSVYLQSVSNLERVADHIFNITKRIKRYCK